MPTGLPYFPFGWCFVSAIGRTFVGNAFQAVTDFEGALCEYTGAPYAVTTTRCCTALQMALEWVRAREVTIPRRTYRGVPQAVVRSGAVVNFDGRVWSGGYSLEPHPIWDYARRFTSGMYRRGEFQCLSFHRSKVLGFTQGGAILCDDLAAANWFRKGARDGENIYSTTETCDMSGFFSYMDPGTAAELHARLHWLPKHNPDLPNSHYPDLSLTNWNDLWLRQHTRHFPSYIDYEMRTTGSLSGPGGDCTS